MKKYIYILIISAMVFNFSDCVTNEFVDKSLFTTDKFIIKSKFDFPISEATGIFSTNTGKKSLDDKNLKYKIKNIKQIFRFNNSNTEIYNKLEMSRYYLLFLDTLNTYDITDIIKEYSADTNLVFCEPNFIGTSAGEKGYGYEYEKAIENLKIPNDEMFGMQWYLQNNGNVSPTGGSKAKIGADISAPEGWEIETGSEDIIVAICDSGIRDDHPDLKERIWINKKEIPNNNIDDDGNGYIDDVRGWDFAYNTNDPRDGFGHGTNIATVIGAVTNNQIGFAGINQKCRLMNCKDLGDNNYGEYEWWAEAVQYAVDNGAKVINMSEGGSDYSNTLKTACEYAYENNVVVVAAMMNKGNNSNNYPAAFKTVIAVGATDTDDKRSVRFSWGGGSCWGKYIAVVAPGNKIYGLDHDDILNYETFWSGTSQSTAIVSAISSLLLTQNPKRTPDDIRNIICKTALDQVGDPEEDSPGWDQYYGWGRVDCYRALTMDTSKNYKTVRKQDNNVITNRKNVKSDQSGGGPAKSNNPRNNKAREGINRKPE
jgi:subtilisin family serine protease